MAFRALPAPDVLAQMDTITKVMTFVPLTQQEQEFIVDALGAEPDTHPAELAMLSESDFDETLSTILPVCSALGRSRIGWLWAYLQEVAKTTLTGTPFAERLPGMAADQSLAPGAPGLPVALPAGDADDTGTFPEQGHQGPDHEEVETAADVLDAATLIAPPPRMSLPTTTSALQSPSPPTPPVIQRSPAPGAEGGGPSPTPVFGLHVGQSTQASAGDAVDQVSPLTSATRFQHFSQQAPNGLHHLPFHPSPAAHPHAHSMFSPATSPMTSPPLSMPTPRSSSVYAHGPPMTVASAQGQVRLDRTVDQNSPLTCALLSPDMIAEMY